MYKKIAALGTALLLYAGCSTPSHPLSSSNSPERKEVTPRTFTSIDSHIEEQIRTNSDFERNIEGKTLSAKGQFSHGEFNTMISVYENKTDYQLLISSHFPHSADIPYNAFGMQIVYEKNGNFIQGCKVPIVFEKEYAGVGIGEHKGLEKIHLLFSGDTPHYIEIDFRQNTKMNPAKPVPPKLSRFLQKKSRS